MDEGTGTGELPSEPPSRNGSFAGGAGEGMVSGSERQAIDRLLLEALKLPLAERSDLLEKVGRRNPAHREELELLLSYEDTAREFAETPVFPRRETKENPLAPGTRLGSYRLKERIGRGGMASVWRGIRAEGDFDQKVAVKILRRGKESEEFLARFRYERQILANLNHPNIAKPLAGGATEDGRPFVVMEYVEGRPLDEYLLASDLHLEERLKIFLTICSAVDHAHRNLVVHRDLKPANILVTPEGRPMLLDFGIAKILSPEVQAPTEQFPLAGPLATRGYGSPEQISGGSISVAADIFSLGVLLFEIATGSRPPAAFYPDISYPMAPSAPPSSSTETASGGRADSSPKVDKDLEAIVRRAMRRNPEERYETVRELTLDVQRFLDSEPVAARQGGLWYRGRKRIKKSPWKLAAAAVCLVLLPLIAFLVWRVYALEHERQSTLKAMEEYTEVGWGKNLRGSSGSPELRDLPPEELLHPKDGISRKNAIEWAAFLDFLGQQDRLAGNPSDAKAHFREALAIRRKYLSPDDPYIALSLERVALLDKAPEFAADGIELLLEALEIRRKVGDEWATANTLNDLALLKKSLGRMTEAAEAYREALRRARGVVGEEDDSLVASLLNNLGTSLRETGQLPEAEVFLTEALAMRQRLDGLRASSTAVVERNLGHLYLLQGRLQEAGGAFRRSLATRLEVYGDPAHSSVALGQRSLGLYHLALGEHDEADRLLSRALASFEASYGPGHSQIARTQRSLAALRLEQGRPAEARDLAEQGLGILRGSLSRQHWQIADLEILLAASWLELGDRDEAHFLLEPAYRRILEAKGGKSPEALTAARLLSRLDAAGA